ncbi:TIGR01212 family radical SAM protein [Tissierella praeacuta]|uniref:TIGR01212 family radical SAM protein n=1 Tax=Tissierella praeacuta TaxID=43131 RepID=UPI0033424DBA
MSKKYNTLNEELRKQFGGKVMKLSLDGGFTCPNRDGTVGARGCIFCSEEGSGEFAGTRLFSLKEQAEEQKKLLSKKWSTDKYIMYFQNFTNTYDSIDNLKALYYESISIQGAVGLAIATRPDCLGEEVLELLSELNEKTYLWIELGLQTIYEKSAKFIRRGYSLSIYDEAIRKLKSRNIRVVTHIIFGLPNESREEMIDTAKYIANTNTWGVKIHSLYIQRNTDLFDYYIKNSFSIMSREEYVSLVADAIELLPKDMVIHRVTGDGKKELIYEPKWSLDKLRVLSMLDKEFKVRNSYQGRNN